MKHDHPTPDATDPLATYTPVALRTRHDGWTAERQRVFLTALAETGCISDAARAAGVTPRSAYHLRTHPEGKAFATAWDYALQLATARLMTIAYERAIKGSVREMWKDGVLVAQVRQPSDRLLIWLLDRLAPNRDYGSGRAHWGVMNWVRSAADPAHDGIGELAASTVPAEPLAPLDAEPDASPVRALEV